MPSSKTKTLSSLFHSAIKTKTSSSSSSILTSPSEDATLKLKHFVSSIDTSSPSTSSPSTSELIVRRHSRLLKSKSRSKKPFPKAATSNISLTNLKLDPASHHDGSKNQISQEISSILCGDTENVGNASDSEGIGDKSMKTVLNVPWVASMLNGNISLRRKEISRERKQKHIFKKTQSHRFDRLVNMCGERIGTEATIQVFGKLGRETGVKEYNALIGICIAEARKTDDDEVSLQQIYKAFQLFKSMSEQGFELEEGTYGPFLMYLIDTSLVDEFHFFCDIIKDKNPSALSRVGYYEMRLWIQMDNKEKIEELCSCVAADNGGEISNIRENYFLALCECDRKKELLQLLEVVDITKISSVDCVTSIFKTLGRLLLESYVEKFILACKLCDHGAENISHFIFYYVISMPNLVVEDVILKFKDLHAKLEVTPSYEKLITHFCDSLKVHAALDIVDQMYETGLTLSIETFHSILHASKESYEFNLVYRIYSVICRHNLKPNNETFRSMINLSVKMKDFEGAYGMLKDLEKLNLKPTSSMYNAIMAGYFREKNIKGGLMVFKQMELEGVKPDSQTFSYLLNNCTAEEDIIKYYEELNCAGIQVTKHIYMALINAYATCGQFEKAKQVVLDKGIPPKTVNEIRSALISALATHGQIADALVLYEEVKQAGCSLEPKAIISLIEHLKSEVELSTLIQLLEELNGTDYWADGCIRIILYCVRYKHLSSAVDLINKFNDRYCDDELAMDALFDEVFCQIAEAEPVDLQIGLDLLQAIKEDFGLLPSRKSLDFLLGACVKAKDSDTARLVWKEFQSTGLPYNILSFLRMYQALLASGDHKSAANMLSKIPKDDPHVRCVIKACQATYVKSNSSKKKKKERNMCSQNEEKK